MLCLQSDQSVKLLVFIVKYVFNCLNDEAHSVVEQHLLFVVESTRVKKVGSFYFPPLNMEEDFLVT